MIFVIQRRICRFIVYIYLNKCCCRDLAQILPCIHIGILQWCLHIPAHNHLMLVCSQTEHIHLHLHKGYSSMSHQFDLYLQQSIIENSRKINGFGTQLYYYRYYCIEVIPYFLVIRRISLISAYNFVGLNTRC